MLVHLYLSSDTLFSFIRYNILKSYRPVSGSVAVPPSGSEGFLDGLEQLNVSQITAAVPQTISFVLNAAAPGGYSIAPVPGVAALTQLALTFSVNGQLFTIAPGDLPAEADPVTGIYARPNRSETPIADAEISLSVQTFTVGDPQLIGNLYKPPAGLDATGAVWKTIASDAQTSIPIPFSSALSQFVGPAPIVNAGLAPTSDGNGYAIRLELDDGALPVPSERLSEWNSFFAGQQQSQLGIRQWAVEAPTAYILQTAASQFDSQLQTPAAQKLFSSGDPSWAEWVTNQPQLVLHKDGIFPNICAGLDIQAELNVTLSLSVPQGNTIRLSIHVDIDKNDWDTFKCAAASILNPISGFITAFDDSSLLPSWIAVPVAVFPGLLIPVGVLALAFSNNSFAISYALKEAQSAVDDSGKTLVRTSDTDCYIDVAVPLGSTPPASWLVLEEVAGVGDRIVLRGDYRPPDFDTPVHVAATLLQGFDNWVKPQCSAPLLSAFSTTAQIQLSAQDPSRKNIPSPALPMVCGLSLDTLASLCWRIVDDPMNVYSASSTLVHWSGAGVPGIFEIVVNGPPESFADAPYALHLQLYTSYGVRQFDVPAPKAVQLPKTDTQRISETAHRISECYAIFSLIGLIKALQYKWLPFPPPYYKSAQHWLIRIKNLSAADRIRAWDVERGTLLAEVGVWAESAAELSMVIAGQAVHTLQITLNDQPLLPVAEYERLSGEVKGRCETAKNPVDAQQTQLLLLQEIKLPQPAKGVYLRRSSGGLLASVWNAEHAWDLRFEPRPARSPIITRNDTQLSHQPQLPAAGMRMERKVLDGKSVALLFSNTGTEIGRFFARPWFDAGSAAGSYYCRLSDDGRRLLLYSRCAPLRANAERGAGSVKMK